MTDIPVGYKQTEVGVIPEDWEVKPIAGLQPFVTSGSRGWAAFYTDHGVPFIRITNLTRGSIYLDLNDLRFVSLPSNNSEGARTQLQEGDVLISITADIGIVGYVSADFPKPAYINQHIALVRFDSSKIHSKFVSYFLASEKPQRLFRALTDAGAKAGMNLTTVKQVRLALPPIKSEQEAIAETLSDADALIESLEQLITKKRYIKQGAMRELLTGKKRLLGFSGEWGMKRLGDLCEKITTGKLDANAMVEGGEYPFFTCAKEHYRIDKYAFDAEVLLVSGNGANVGYVHYYHGKFNAYQRTYVLSGFSSNIQFIKLFMERNLQERIRVEVNAGNTPYIVMGTLADMLVTLPINLKEQTAIATILSDMDAEISALETRLAKTRSLKQGMMHNLLTGRIRLIESGKLKMESAV